MQHYSGIYFEKGPMQGCYIAFQNNAHGFSIGTEAIDGVDLIIENTQYVYLCILGAGEDAPYEYHVVEDFDGPVKLRHSGHIYDYGTLRIRLL